MLSALFFTFNASAQIKNDSINVIKNDTLNITKKDTIINNQKVEYEIGKEYILGGITVTGLKKFSEETVKVFTGLVNGQLLLSGLLLEDELIIKESAERAGFVYQETYPLNNWIAMRFSKA